MPIKQTTWKKWTILRKLRVSKTKLRRNNNKKKMNQPITSTEIKTGIKSLPKAKAQCPKSEQSNSIK